MDRQTGLQGLDNEGGILRRDIPNTLGANSQDHFVPEPFGSSTYPFDTFPPQLPDFTQAQASYWVTYGPDRVKQTALPMLDDPRLDSETTEALNNLFSEHNKPTPVSPDSVISEANIESNEDIQKEDHPVHSRKKRFIGNIVPPEGDTAKILVKVVKPSWKGGLDLCDGAILSPKIVITAAHCTPVDLNPNKTLVTYQNKVFKVENMSITDSIAKEKFYLVGRTDDIALIKLSTPLPDSALRVEVNPSIDIYGSPINYQLKYHPPSSGKQPQTNDGDSCQDKWMVHHNDIADELNRPTYLAVAAGSSGDQCEIQDFIPKTGFFRPIFNMQLEEPNSTLCEPTNSTDQQLDDYCASYNCTITKDISPFKRNMREPVSYKFCSGDSGSPLLAFNPKTKNYQLVGVASGWTIEGVNPLQLAFKFGSLHDNKEWFENHFNISESNPLPVYHVNKDRNLDIPYKSDNQIPKDHLEKPITVSLNNQLYYGLSWFFWIDRVDLELDVFSTRSGLTENKYCKAGNYDECAVTVASGAGDISAMINLGQGRKWYNFNVSSLNEIKDREVKFTVDDSDDIKVKVTPGNILI